MKTQIVECPKCSVRNRVATHSTAVTPICGRCGTSLAQPLADNKPRRSRDHGSSHYFSVGLLVLGVAAACCGIAVTPTLMRGGFSRLAMEESRETEAVRTHHEQELAARKAVLEDALAAVDANDLRRRASDQYKREIEGRRSYDKRFALTLREKAQLRMADFASDSTASPHDAIRAVAREASPHGSDITVHESYRGIALHIDFDMSSVTSQESGITTKHLTKDSLRREVLSLVSRATNDIFLFCRDLDVHTIHVGCRHFVRVEYPDGTTRDENTILYKIRIQKARVPRVASNPFLDVYSTADYFEVDEDNFADIELRVTWP